MWDSLWNWFIDSLPATLSAVVVLGLGWWEKRNLEGYKRRLDKDAQQHRSELQRQVQSELAREEAEQRVREQARLYLLQQASQAVTAFSQALTRCDVALFRAATAQAVVRFGLERADDSVSEHAMRNAARESSERGRELQDAIASLEAARPMLPPDLDPFALYTVADFQREWNRIGDVVEQHEGNAADVVRERVRPKVKEFHDEAVNWKRRAWGAWFGEEA